MDKILLLVTITASALSVLNLVFYFLLSKKIEKHTENIKLIARNPSLAKKKLK